MENKTEMFEKALVRTDFPITSDCLVNCVGQSLIVIGTHDSEQNRRNREESFLKGQKTS